MLSIELNGVSNVRTTPSISTIEWDQLGSGLESQCITHYRLTWAGGMYDTPNNSTSVSATVLSSAGFPYCQTRILSVTPMTLVGPVTRGNGSTSVMLRDPGYNVVIMILFVLYQYVKIFLVRLSVCP